MTWKGRIKDTTIKTARLLWYMQDFLRHGALRLAFYRLRA